VALIAYKIVDMIVGLRVTEEVEREGLDINDMARRPITCNNPSGNLPEFAGAFGARFFLTAPLGGTRAGISYNPGP